MTILDFSRKIDELKQTSTFAAIIKVLGSNPWIYDCTLPQLEQYSSELDGVVRRTRVPELTPSTIDAINKCLADVSASYSRVSELKIYFMRLNVEWERYFPIIYAQFESCEWIKTFRNKETRHAIIAELFSEYHDMARLCKYLVEKCDIILKQFNAFTFSLRDQRENLRLECQYFMSNNVAQSKI